MEDNKDGICSECRVNGVPESSSRHSYRQCPILISRGERRQRGGFHGFIQSVDGDWLSKEEESHEVAWVALGADDPKLKGLRALENET